MRRYFIDFILLFLSLLFIEIYFIFLTGNKIFSFELIRIILFSVTFASFISLITSFLKPIISKTINAIIVFSLGFYALLQLGFKNFMGNFMSLSMLSGGSVDRVNNEVSTFIASIKLNYYLMLLPFVLLIFIYLWKKNWFINKKISILNRMILFLGIITIYFSSLLTLNITPQNQLKNNKQLYKSPNLIDISLREFGVQKFLTRDFIFLLNGNTSSTVINIIDNEPKDEERDNKRTIDDSNWLSVIAEENNQIIKNLHQYYINQSITDKNEYTGIFKDKNLILIMVEAFDMSAIDPILTPTLYKMSQNGWYFNNYYAPKFSCTTGESEFIALTSIIPSNSVCTPYEYVNNNYGASIFNLFNESGYRSTSYHSWTDQYYPRTKLHKNMGSSFYNADLLNINTQGSWPSDVELMQKAYENYSKYEKYFSFTITVSMHFTYDRDNKTVIKNWNKVKNLDTGTPMKRYLAKAIEFDESMKFLLDRLESDGKLDDTVIALFGDHHPYNLDFDYINAFSDIDRYDALNEDLMPFIIYNETVDPKIISKTSSTFDILPTIANLFDLNYDPRYYTGKDIFSDEESIVIFPNGNWVTDKAVYYASKNNFEIKDNNTSDEYITKTNQILANKFIASDNTLNYDYFKYRFTK